jgi:small multidrug resistance pump
MPAGMWLALAIVAEVIATSSLKASAAFTRPLPSRVVIAGYAAAFYCLSLALRSMPVDIAYAIWSGFGIVLVTAIPWIVYGQKLDAFALTGMALIIASAIILNLRAASG